MALFHKGVFFTSFVWTMIYLSVIFQVTNSQTDFDKDPILNYASLDKPFRMQKCNIAWDKARTKPLQESKLKLLYYELKLQDKEEIALKKLKSEIGDKDGLREAQVRKKFNGIMNTYGLVREDKSQNEEPLNQRIFKDKKLDRLWDKAQAAGLEDDELMLLKKEFQHHQEKVDEYHRLKEMVSAGNSVDGNRRSNELHLDDDDYDHEEIKARDTLNNEIDGKVAKDIKKNYERLHRIATNTHPMREFEEPKVNGLWRIAQEADFNEEELQSIRKELKHYEQRLQKLHLLTAELDMVDKRRDGEDDLEKDDGAWEKTDGRKRMDTKLKKHKDTVDKLHNSLKNRIASRHSEL